MASKYDWTPWDTVNINNMPFDIWREMYGDNAAIYVTVVGDHNHIAEKTCGYTEGKVHAIQLNDLSIQTIDAFAKSLMKHKAVVLYQRVRIAPPPPDKYEIVADINICGHMDRKAARRCDYYDDGYCLIGSEQPCEHQCKTIACYIKI